MCYSYRYFILSVLTTSSLYAEEWVIESQDEWQANLAIKENISIEKGMLTPTANSSTYHSTLKSFLKKRKPTTITISQSPTWQNWNPTAHIGPINLQDAPIALSLGPENYWLFGRYGTSKKTKHPSTFTSESRTVEGFDIPLTTTPYKNQYNSPTGLNTSLGGYHAWQSRDMKTWVHHGSVSDKEAKWMTTAEQVGNKTYFYYDFPNDQDPHLIIDSDLTDGKIGKKMGIAFKDPSHCSDSAIIRDLEGKFHLILENWSPIKASARSWDSPLASHAVSDDGISDFKLLAPAVDYRTHPTGKKGTYKHPHWAKEDPQNYKQEKLNMKFTNLSKKHTVTGPPSL